MKSFLKQLKYELLLFVRQPIYVFLIMIFPPIMLLIFASMYGNNQYEGIRFFDKYLPAYIFSMSFSIVLFSVGLEGVERRESGIMKMLKTKPTSNVKFNLIQIIKSIIISSFGFIELLLISVFVYDVDLSNVNLKVNYLVFIVILMINSYIFISIFSGFKNFKVALMASLIVYQIIMFLSDFTIPVSQLPEVIRKIAEFNPFYHLNHIFIGSWNNDIVSAFTMNSFISIAMILVIASIMQVYNAAKKDE